MQGVECEGMLLFHVILLFIYLFTFLLYRQPHLNDLVQVLAPVPTNQLGLSTSSRKPHATTSAV